MGRNNLCINTINKKIVYLMKEKKTTELKASDLLKENSIGITELIDIASMSVFSSLYTIEKTQTTTVNGWPFVDYKINFIQ